VERDTEKQKKSAVGGGWGKKKKDEKSANARKRLGLCFGVGKRENKILIKARGVFAEKKYRGCGVLSPKKMKRYRKSVSQGGRELSNLDQKTGKKKQPRGVNNGK